jgi:hypothetical protein
MSVGVSAGDPGYLRQRCRTWRRQQDVQRSAPQRKRSITALFASRRNRGRARRSKRRAERGNLSLRMACRGDAPDFVEVGEAGIAVDYAMRRQRRVQLVG